MKVRCVHNTGEALRAYESKELSKNELGKFGATCHTDFGVTIGKEYVVMGMLMGEGVLDYLIDDGGNISAYPYPLFEVIDSNLSPNWFFKSYKNTDKSYPYQEAVWGYHELVFDDAHYEKLVE
ncbi:MAG: hypothetical protein AAF934_00730, partial [Bacteroidota bacterium]